MSKILETPDWLNLGTVHTFSNPLKKKFYGEKYLPHKLLLDIPSYQTKILVECLSGADKGLWFTTTINHFRITYKCDVDK